jgi:hypothetical protein
LTHSAALRALLAVPITLVLLWSVAGCCRDEVGGVLVINDTADKITVDIAGGGYGPWVIEPGRDAVPYAAPGPSTITIRSDDRTWGHPVTLGVEDLLVVPASSDGCIALADYARQFGGDGEVEVWLTASAREPAHISLDGDLYLGVDDPLPKGIYPGTPVRRFTRVPCGLISDERALKAHLWALD